MDARCFIGVDVGSASVRAGVFDDAGQELAFATRPIRQFNPRSDCYEQSSADIWTQLCAAVREAVAGAAVPVQTVQGIGFDATCSLVAVGATGEPVSVAEDGDPQRDIVMWMDHRAMIEAAVINATRDPALDYVGGFVSVEMELPKALWLQRHLPQRHAAVWRYFDLADYLVWRATGADVASVCTLTCKWNYLAHEQRFSTTLLAAVGLSGLLDKVPTTVLPLGSAAGTLSRRAAAELGLLPSTVVATGIIDAHAGGLALLGAAPDGGLAIISGTSCCHLAVSRQKVMVPGVWGPYFGAMLPGWWLNEAGQSAAGSLIDWTLHQSDAWPTLEAAARDTGRGVYDIANEWVAALEAREANPTRNLHVLADHHGNRSPRADPLARGIIAGLTLERGPDALARRYLATVQALAYGTRHIVEALNTAGHHIGRVLITGGGIRNAVSLREHADALGRDLHLGSEDQEVTRGAALLAATASGAFPDLQAAAGAMVRAGTIVRANAERRAFHDAKYAVYLALYDDWCRYRRMMSEPPHPSSWPGLARP
jgi:FGGY-family pentulose kinase